MQTILLSFFILQGFIMALDEFYFHHKRRLPRWERIGHPADTMTVLICFLFLKYNLPEKGTLTTFILLGSFSCLFVTKDEWVHSQHCEAFENWLHALLFVLHPMVLTAAGYIWYNQTTNLQWLLNGQVVILSVFLIYQILYWNLPFFKQPKSINDLSASASLMKRRLKQKNHEISG